MKISVCMATFNGAKFIKAQLDSILCQLRTNDEIIISDDNSNDNTLNIIKNYNDERIKIFINVKENRGYTKNFENAITKASGEVIFICDQDDVWNKNKVEVMLKHLKTASLVIHNARIVDGNLKLLNESHFNLYEVKNGFFKNFFKTRYIGACMAFKKEILLKALPFPHNQKLCAYDYWLTLIAEFYYNVELVQEPLIYYRRHSSNASTGGNFSANSLFHKIKVRIYSLYQLLKR
jgi:glycosyltransferase involved in cell wall biosynthesis